jgi:tetratricopeptide (TPR) repeat protein
MIEDYEDSENVIDEEMIRKDFDGLKVRKISNGQKDIIDLTTKLTESKVNQTLSNQKSNKVLVRKVSVWLAAASVAILMATSITLLVGKRGTVDYMAVYEKNFSAPYADLPSRSLIPGIDDSYTSALEQYNEAEYENAYQIFNEIPEGSVNNPSYYLYKGVTAMKVGDFQMALGCFAKIQPDPVHKHEGIWYMGLSYLAVEDIPAARKVLEEIIATDGHYKKQAKKLLKSI